VHVREAPRSAGPVTPDLLDRAETITGALAELVERFPDHTCLTVVDRSGAERPVALAALWRRACAVRSALAARGVAPGRFVVIVLPTGSELAAAYFGAMLAGAVPALLAPAGNRFADRAVYSARLRRLLEHANAAALYCEPDVAALVAGEAAAVPVVTPADVSGAPPASRPTPADPDAVATVQYSSGSTGDPKGVLLTHRAILSNLRATRDGFGLTADDVTVNWLPLYHDMGLIDAFLLPVLVGCRAILIPTLEFMREPVLWLRAIERHRGTLSLAPNFAYALCAQRIPDEELAGLDLSSWRVAFNGSEPVLASTIAAFADRFRAHGFDPAGMTPGWGLAESVCIATMHPVGERPAVETIDRRALAVEGVARPVSGDGIASVGVGRALPGCRVEVRDADRRALPERRVGSIWVGTDFLFAGYHRDPARTAAVLVDGWLDTADLGYLVGDQLYFVSRDKDLIVIGGEKYAPQDVETAINEVPGVRAGCAVAFGVVNEVRGTEDVGAVVETKETDPTALDALRDAIRSAVMRATGLGLRHVVLVPPGGVEKTTSGKLARAATRRRWADRLG
jgi:fatty-acyl-CoA synthase